MDQRTRKELEGVGKVRLGKGKGLEKRGERQKRGR